MNAKWFMQVSSETTTIIRSRFVVLWHFGFIVNINYDRKISIYRTVSHSSVSLSARGNSVSFTSEWSPLLFFFTLTRIHKTQAHRTQSRWIQKSLLVTFDLRSNFKWSFCRCRDFCSYSEFRVYSLNRFSNCCCCCCYFIKNTLRLLCVVAFDLRTSSLLFA